MSCTDFRRRFDAYLDRELDTTDRAAVEQHLEDCRDCRREIEAQQSVIDAAHALEKTLTPSRDLWPAIERRIEAGRSTSQTGWLQWAAAAIALLVLSIPISVWWTGRSDSGSTASVEMATENDSLATQAVMARSEDGVLLPRTDLIAAIERHRDVVEDTTLVVFEENMQLIDQAIGELHAALEADPQNLRLRMLLASRYQQERRLLQKVNRV